MVWMTSTDQMGNVVELPNRPQRIISLVPSQTELLFDLELSHQVVGITKFCVHPAHWHKSKTIIGGTKNFHFDTIQQLNPDLIIGNKEENYAEGISELKKHYRVWMSDITTIDDALSMIYSISSLTDRALKGEEIVTQIQSAFNELKDVSPISTLYVMWRDPWMGVANQTFIHFMMEKIGLVNVLSDRVRYPELTDSEIRKLNPTLVLLSTEPFPFSEKYIHEIKRILPDAKVLIVDGETFSWYGSRMRAAPAYFDSLNFS